jgi:hypothetical protein
LQRLQRFSAGLPHALSSSISQQNYNAREPHFRHLHLGSSINSSKLFWPYLAQTGLFEERGRGRMKPKGSVHIGYVLKLPPFFFLAYVANEAARGGDDL